MSDFSSHEQQLRHWIDADATLMDILRAARECHLPNWCIAGGAIRNLAWDRLHDLTEAERHLPSDIDLLYFDAALARTEAEIERELRERVPDVEWEPVNQATIHLYNRDRPYVSTADALGRWAETATAVGVNLDNADKLHIVAPQGLDDLFNLIARPNLVTPDAAQVYRRRLQSKGWQEKWPRLQVIWPEQ